MTMFRYILVLLLIICCATVTSASQDGNYKAVRSSAEGPAVCGQDNPAAKYTVRSRVECSSKCRKDAGCLFFNFIKSLNQKPACHLYYNEPQMKNVEQHCTLYRREGVKSPVADCSFPYTYKRWLFYRCLDNMTEVQPCGCRAINFTPTPCYACPGFEATHARINIQIPTQPGEIPVMSVFGWIIIHQHFGQNLDWYLPWADYKAGFGDINADFWLGLEKIHLLTTSQPYRLRAEVQDAVEGLWYSAEYWSFHVEDEVNKYRLHVSWYSGDAGNGLQNTEEDGGKYLHDGKMFSTYDNDNDPSSSTNCADAKEGGWWFARCYTVCLACTPTTDHAWWGLPGEEDLLTSRMMIKLQ